MIINVVNRCEDYNSYRASRVKSLFNPERGNEFILKDEIDIPDEWQIGLIVGPSGTGKTSIGKSFFDTNRIIDIYSGWEKDKPVIDCIAPKGDFNTVTGALANVGLGDVPSWLRPFHALSNGQQFRAGLARVMVEAPDNSVVDEFTSVIDRQIAKIGALAFSKGWRRNKGKRIVLLSCHYDIIEWLQPDWVYDTGNKTFKKKTKSGNGQRLTWNFGRLTTHTGNCLSHIII